jgi:alpha-amylase
MQQSAHAALYALADDIHRIEATGDAELLEAWRKLTTSDHVYYMATAEHSDAEVHEYFSPYDSPHESYLVFMHVLDDLRARVRAVLGSTVESTTDAREARP